MGGTDALSRLTFSGFNALRLMDRSLPTLRCGPRAGMNIGEGAGILVLEDWMHARREARRSTPSSPATASRCEAYHPTAPEPEGKPSR